jgi:predicted XRE-type DNA-binding protein
MKKKNMPTTDSVLDFIEQVEKEGKKGKLPVALSKDAPFEEQMKFSLCKLFVHYVLKHQIKAVELAEMLELPKTRVSDIMNYKTEKYTVDRLLSYAWKLAELDAPTKEHLHLMYELLSGPVRSVRDAKKIEKELQKYA